MTQQITIPRALLEQLVMTLEFMWRDVSMNEYAFEKLEEALTAGRAALEGAERAAWQPIETAPHDGTSFMAGWFDGPSNPGCNMRPIKRYMGAWWESNEDYKVRTPTHWMPLPTPPKEQP